MNMLIVDDEDFVLDYLTDHIEKEQFGIQQIFRANSVGEALCYVGENVIDIIITDIRMPEKSGLELLAQIRNQTPGTIVILLSGYAEFDYAKQALSHGAFDYLLKPASPDEINECIDKALKERQRHDQQIKHNDREQDQKTLTNIQSSREQLLLDLLLGSRYTVGTVSERIAGLGMKNLSDSHVKLAILRLEAKKSDTQDSLEDIQLLSYSLANIAEEVFNTGLSEPCFWSCRDPHNYTIVLFNESYWKDEDQFHNKFLTFQQQVQLYLNRSVSILISQSHVFPKQLDHVYLEALKYFWKHIGSHTDELQYMNTSIKGTEYRPLSRLYQPPSIQNLLESGQWHEASDRLNFIFQELESDLYRTQDHLLEIYYYLCNALSYIAHKQGLRLLDLVEQPEYLRNGYYFKTPAQLKNWVLSLIEQFQKSFEEPTSRKHSHIIMQVHRFIDQHLNEDVTLKTIADHIYLHPVYLSRLYKKEMGMTLSAYITKIRLEKAVYLLTQTNKKIFEISKEIGYHKPQYFISLFKEQYLLTPQEFRDKQLVESADRK
ncbi:response regulator [Paenibacillus sp. GCM10028914]|uniref:response regulator transcription factor n=1 Tax=Paenibacillus sp. GCM10028914 TaxID=3273416 RepID=UPI00361C5698